MMIADACGSGRRSRGHTAGDANSEIDSNCVVLGEGKGLYRCRCRFVCSFVRSQTHSSRSAHCPWYLDLSGGLRSGGTEAKAGLMAKKPSLSLIRYLLEPLTVDTIPADCNVTTYIVSTPSPDFISTPRPISSFLCHVCCLSCQSTYE